jgi:L-amino acid N-acyltransferase YncA
MTSSIAPRVRPAGAADADAILRIYGGVVTDSVASFEEEPPDRREILRRMTARPRMPWLVAEQVAESDDEAGEVVGYTAASRHRHRAAYRWTAECAIHLDPAHRGRGIGRLLYERLIAEMGDLGYVRLLAAVAMPNDASVRLHERLGFRPVGVVADVGFKQGSWRDVSWWSLQLPPALPRDPQEPREWVPDPTPPAPS